MQSTVLPSKGANAHMTDPNVTYLAYKRRRCKADFLPWPIGFSSRCKSTGVQNQNLRTNLRWVTKRIRKSARKFTQVAKSLNFRRIQMICDQLVSTCVGWPNGEKSAWTCVQIWAPPKLTQVSGQTKRKLNASRKLALTCVDLRVNFGQGVNQ